MIVLIPSLEPDHRLPELVRALRDRLPRARVLIVDDGSGPAYAQIFGAAARLGAIIIGYPTNRGKGFALRHGFMWCLTNAPGESVVCADSDGQHTPADIAHVAEESEAFPEAVVLGVRGFTGDVPLRSRFGNSASALFFRMVSGRRVSDTQTGLRAYGHRQLAELLEVPGERFEWELSALLTAANAGREIRQVPISTVYLDHNSGSHFRPVADSLRVFRPLVAFAGSGVITWALEMVLFLLLLQSRIGLIAAVVVARLVSCGVNFAINKFSVFRDASHEGVRRQAIQYGALAVVLMALTAVGVRLLVGAGLPAWFAKITMDVGGSILSFVVQHRLIFARRAKSAGIVSEEARRLSV
ncbi:bifunctional glycosyltransferase family 2/GtrA family protein [Actinomycetaceae bacterium L2_0104]